MLLQCTSMYTVRATAPEYCHLGLSGLPCNCSNDHPTGLLHLAPPPSHTSANRHGLTLGSPCSPPRWLQQHTPACLQGGWAVLGT